MTTPEQTTQSENLQPVSRRRALIRTASALAGLAGTSLLLTGCASSSTRPVATGTTPGSHEAPQVRRNRSELLDRWGSGTRAAQPDRRHTPGAWEELPSISQPAPAMDYLVRRNVWSKGNPVPSLMDRMLPIDKITVHHDGMSAFLNTSESAAAARIEAIRRSHRNNNWGDIGYHYLIDPNGRVWEGRPLSWQGAHVRDHNQGNIGICVLGNYEQQAVNDRQMQALERFIAANMREHRIQRNRVYTHQEFSPTACPGRSLQARMNSVRASRSSELAFV